MFKVICGLVISFVLIGCFKVEKKIVVYDFYTEWCPPCKRFSPIFDNWKEKYSSNNVTFVKIDAEKDDLSSKFGISSVPTVIITHDGKEVKRFVGIPQEEEVVKCLE